jgi:hypothetical protein
LCKFFEACLYDLSVWPVYWSGQSMYFCAYITLFSYFLVLYLYASCFWIVITGSEHCSYTSVFQNFVSNLSSLALYMKMIQTLLMPLFTLWLCISLELGEWLSLCILDKLYLWNWFSYNVSYYLSFFWSLFLVDTVSYHFLCQISKGWQTKLNII